MLHTISGSKEQKGKGQNQELHQKEGSRKEEGERQEGQGCKQELHPSEDLCTIEAWAGVGVRGGIRKEQQAAAS